jgi:hypothetical protein
MFIRRVRASQGTCNGEEATCWLVRPATREYGYFSDACVGARPLGWRPKEGKVTQRKVSSQGGAT